MTTTRVSLAELAASGIQLHPQEAVAIVAELCQRCHDGGLRGVPPPGVIRVTRDGDLVVEGPMTTGDDVARAAHVLSDLLADYDAVPEYRASGALRLVIARALGMLDVPPYATLAEFCAALQRFAAADVRETARSLFNVWERTRASHQLDGVDTASLTISDIRRARRATGMSLNEIARVAEVNATQLRDLEWGYMRNWRADADGRAQIVRYARAAGLDEGLVLSIAWPLIQEAAGTALARPDASVALVPAAPARALLPPPPRARIGRSLVLGGWILAAVAAILLAVLTGVAIARMSPRKPAQSVQVGASTPPSAADDSETAPVALRPVAAMPDVVPASTRTAVEPVDAAAAALAADATRGRGDAPRAGAEATRAIRPPAHTERSRATRAAKRPSTASQKRRQAHKPNIFEREWIRFVFR